MVQGEQHSSCDDKSMEADSLDDEQEDESKTATSLTPPAASSSVEAVRTLRRQRQLGGKHDLFTAEVAQGRVLRTESMAAFGWPSAYLATARLFSAASVVGWAFPRLICRWRSASS